MSNEIVKLFEGLRVADVRDGLDWIGMPNKGSVDRSIMPIAEGMKFCGPAFTVRSRVTQKQVPQIIGDEYTKWARDYWYKEVQIQPWDDELSPGDIVVLESPDAGCGEIGSYNSLDMHVKGAAAVVTSGGARDHDECVAQGVPIFAAHRNQAMTQGRVEYETYGIPVSIGGVQVKPGDIVVGDGDGVVVVPLEVAEEVAKFARQENENDKARSPGAVRARRPAPGRLGPVTSGPAGTERRGRTRLLRLGPVAHLVLDNPGARNALHRDDVRRAGGGLPRARAGRLGPARRRPRRGRGVRGGHGRRGTCSRCGRAPTGWSTRP